MKKSTSVRKSARPAFRLSLESLEPRLTLSAYTVSSLADAGSGSLRAAITSVNGDSTPDEIDFSVAGVIKLTSGPLPAITNTVTIDGTTAPGFASAPVVEIDNNGFAGLAFDGTYDGSSSRLASLSIVNANGPGVTLAGPVGEEGRGGFITVVGNYIGLALDGSIAANTGVGLLDLTPYRDTIGGTTPADRNVISGNGAGGIQLGPGGSERFGQNSIVEGNYIGTDPSGQAAAGNRGNGLALMASLGGEVIGGTEPGAGNIIAFNSQSGVLAPRGIQNQILSNSIFSNGAHGIELQNGISNMDIPGAPRLNYAVESPGATAGTAQVQVGGVLNTVPGLTCTIQVFATMKGVPAGQGQLFLGSVEVTTNRHGFAAFTFTDTSVPTGDGTTFTATATAVNTSEFSNSIGSSTPSQTPSQNFVTSAYGLLLNRAPDAGGAGFWANGLNSGMFTPAGVVLGIERSAEYIIDQIDAMYPRYLNRPAGPLDEQHWVAFVEAGGTFEQVAAALVSTQEYYVLKGGTDQGFIAGLYNDVLNGGNPTTADLAYWATTLGSGASRASVAIAFVNSQEYRRDLVQNDYTTFLLRAADAGGLANWVNALNAAFTDQEVLAEIFGSPEGYQRWS